jgi:hypothetical protein
VIERSPRLERAPELRVVNPDELGDSTDADEYVRNTASKAFRTLMVAPSEVLLGVLSIACATSRGQCRSRVQAL